MPHFTFIAHQGFSAKAPGNTLAAFDLALAGGYTNIELDVQLTADSAVVVFHDKDVDRITNGTGPLASFKLAELRALDAGAWFDHRFRNERIPTLEEVLRRYTAKIHLHLELKSDQPLLPGKVATLLGNCDWVLDATHDPFQVPGLTITSEHLEQLKRSKELLPAVAHHWMSRRLDTDIIATALTARLQGLAITPEYAEPTLIAAAQAKGLTVRGLGVKSKADITKFVQSGAEGATVDWPDEGYAMLSSPADTS
jgi:glycerophosphoryl diester phosphodiesterase